MIVFLDLDGVLVDFNKTATKILGVEYPPKKWHWYEDTPGGFEKINNACTTHFWANLDWTPDGHDIFRLVVSYVKPENIYFLTCPMPNLESATGKAIWVNKHLPVYNKRLIITCAPKHLFAGPDKLLIDDKDENVINFARKGGSSILVPRPWNHHRSSIDKTYQTVKDALEREIQ